MSFFYAQTHVLVYEKKPETKRPNVSKGSAQSRCCCISLVIAYVSGEIPIKLRDSWFPAKYVYA